MQVWLEHHLPESFVVGLRVTKEPLLKPDGNRKCRLCLDGSKQAAPSLHAQVQIYSSCIELPALRLLNVMYEISFSNVCNAFQQSPLPTHQCYIKFDQPMIDWYQCKFKVELDWKRYIIRLHGALQEHLQANA
eukprot:scaffold1341_cov178-Amphora_coffeaeformis.AAC.2